MRKSVIPSAVHGCIDYGVAGLFEGAARSNTLSPAVRRTLALGGAYHAGYSLVTDYERGMWSLISMRQHLLLDTLGAAALCVAGLALPSASESERRLLLAAGLAELAVVGLSTPVSSGAADPATGGPATGAPAADSKMTYAPVDTLKPVADGVFIVDSTLRGLFGMTLPVRMTVIRLPDGGLLLHSPTRLTEGLKRVLRQLGPVRHLLAPNVAHWVFLREWQETYPDAIVWSAPGLRQRRAVRRNGLRIDHELAEAPPAAWGDALDLTMVPGGLGFHEIALFHRPTRTLVLTDLVLNLEAGKLPGSMRILARLFGSLAPGGMAPPYLRMIVRMRASAARRACERIMALEPERVLFAHGRWFETDATRQLRTSLRWLGV